MSTNDRDVRDADEHEHDKHERKDERGRTIVGVFPSRAEGREAIAALHKAKYKHTWLGTTSVAHTSGAGDAVTVETPGNFFSGTQSLIEALVSRGVRGDIAHRIEGGLEPGNALVTVDPKNEDPSTAQEILRDYGGDVGGTATAATTTRGTFAPRGTTAHDDLHDDADDVEWEEVVFYSR